MFITATICTIGDEILIGQVIDTNSSMISRRLNAIGVKVVRMVSTSDDEQEIISTIKSSLSESDIVILTGGLGPTKDDITKKTLAKLTGATGYIQNDEQFAVIERITKARGIELSDINRAQASVPNSAKVIVNDVGTAPCMMFVIPAEEGKEKVLFSLPGVPFEAKEAMPKIEKEIKNHFKLSHIFHKTICTFGIPESTLAKQIEEWEDNLPEKMHLAYLPDPILGVRLRLSVYDSDQESGEAAIDIEVEKLRSIIKDAIYSIGESSPQEALGKLLSKRGETLSTAESCTGGKVASLLTSVSGASEYFYGGVVSYDNSVKINCLGVKKETIEKYGAVSKECVEEMAQGVRKLMKTTYSIATSGVAGPNGGSENKPVGLVWIAVCSENFTISKEFKFSGLRNVNIERFASNAINLLRLQIENE